MAGAAVGLACAATASAGLLVYDGVPASGAGAYTTGSLYNQNPTNTSIIGESGTWTGDATSTTAISVDGTGLTYPPGVLLSGLGGSVYIANAQIGGAGVRSLKRALSPTLSGKSFYFSVLMGFNDLSSLANGAALLWGVTKTKTGTQFYPASDGVLVGFQRTATGVDAVLRVLNTTNVLQSGVSAGTYFFVGKFVYNAGGNDTVHVSLNPGATEPSSWTTSVTAEVLTNTTNFAWVNVGGNYGVNGKRVAFDEWRVGDIYGDVAGSTEVPPTMVTLAATNVTAVGAWLNGQVASTGTATTVVSVYHGTSDGGNNAALWQATNTFSGTVTTVPQDYTVQATGLTSFVRYYYRYAASNAYGFAWASASTNFLPQPVGLPAITNAAVGNISKTKATLTGNLATAAPPVMVYACWDTADRGTTSTGAWARVALVGTYSFPTNLSYEMTGLLANNGYVCRLFATNDLGRAWSDLPVSFNTVIPQVYIIDAYGYEGNAGLTNLPVAVILDAASASDVTVNFATSNGTALAGADYVASTGTCTILAGTTATNITLNLIGNTVETFPGKGFWVNMTNPVGATQSAGTVKAEAGILDDDMGARLFYDDFDDGNANGWLVLTNSAGWSVSGKRYRYGYHGVYGNNQAGSTNWDDCSLRVMWGSDNAGKAGGIRMRAQGTNEPSGGYVFTFYQWNTYLKAGTNLLASTGDLGLRLSTIGGVYVLRPVSMRLRTVPTGTHIQCYYGFRTIYDLVDTNNYYPRGMIGLAPGDWANAAYFDNVEVFAEPGPKGTVMFIR